MYACCNGNNKYTFSCPIREMYTIVLLLILFARSVAEIELFFEVFKYDERVFLISNDQFMTTTTTNTTVDYTFMF